MSWTYIRGIAKWIGDQIPEPAELPPVAMGEWHRHERDVQIRSLAREGFTDVEIADRIGVERTTVDRALRVPPPTRRRPLKRLPHEVPPTRALALA